jgi:ADP-ribosylglycohydrolase
MIGAIIGDIVGSPYEMKFTYEPNFPLFTEKSRFTDDTVLTCATAQALMLKSFIPCSLRFARMYRQWGLRYPDRGYGSKFKAWVKDRKYPIINSNADGCMMRCSPIAMFYEDRDLALKRALQSIAYTHNSPESARGVQSIVDALWMARHKATKIEIQNRVEEYYGHMLNLSLGEWRARSSRVTRCNLIAPQALTCFMASNNYETAIRNAVYTLGDTDTVASIAGALAEAFYGTHSIPKSMYKAIMKIIPPEMNQLIRKFYETCKPSGWTNLLIDWPTEYGHEKPLQLEVECQSTQT